MNPTGSPTRRRTNGPTRERAGTPTQWRNWALRHWADPLYRQSYLMLASTAASAGTGLLFWVAAARRSPPEVVGTAAGLVAAMGFLSYLTSFALPYAVLRFGATRGVVSSMVNGTLAVSAATSLLAAAVFALVCPLASPALAARLHAPADVLLFGLAGVGAATSLLLDNLLAARRRSGVVLARNGLAGVARLAALPLTGAGDPRGLYLAATLPILASAAAVLAALPRLLPGYRPRHLRLDPLLRATASFAVRNYPAALLSGAPQFVLPLIAVSVLGTQQYAFFFAAWSVAQVVHLVPVVVANILLSQGATGPVAALDARARRFSLLLLTPTCAACITATTVILGLYGGSYTRGATTALRLLVLAALPWSLIIVTQARLRIEHRYTAVTWLTGCLCLISLALPLAAAPAFGATGIAAGWAIAMTTTAILARTLTHPRRTAPP